MAIDPVTTSPTIAEAAAEGRMPKKETAMKLDAKFYGTIVKAKDGSVVPEDEYVVFLAKDNAFARVLPMYRTICTDLGCDQEQIDALDRMIIRLEVWRASNPDRLKVPDAKGEKLLG